MKNQINQIMKINTEQTKKAALMIRAVSHPVAQQIIKFISEKGKSKVNAIYHELEKEQSVVSLHLSKLKKAGFVSCEKKGQERIYSLNVENLDKFNETLSEIVK